MKNNTYHLRIYDNFHYMDESEANNSSDYASYEEALAAAKNIVQSYFRDKTRSLDEQMTQFCLYGEDPVIVSKADGSVDRSFSAKDYANAYVEELNKTL